MLYPLEDTNLPGYTTVNQSCVKNAIDSAAPQVSAAIAAARTMHHR
jgi:hypothetical protein